MNGILGLEQPVEFTMRDLFDPTMAQIALNARQLYVNVLKEDYKEFLADQKLFYKDYGDFYSPIASDNAAYFNMTKGKLQQVYNDLVEQGIDPIRSVEGRAAMSRAMNSIDYHAIAAIKASAENAKQFIKSRDALIAAGKYNKEMDAAIGGAQLDNWDSTRNGIFQRTSPVAYQSLNELTQNWFDLMDKTILETSKDGKWDIIGRDKTKAADIINTHLNSENYRGTPMLYHLDKIKNDVLKQVDGNPLLANSPEAVAGLIRAAQIKAIVGENGELFTTSKSENKDYGAKRDFAYKSALQKESSALSLRNSLATIAAQEKSNLRILGAKNQYKQQQKNAESWTNVVDTQNSNQHAASYGRLSDILSTRIDYIKRGLKRHWGPNQEKTLKKFEKLSGFVKKLENNTITAKEKQYLIDNKVLDSKNPSEAGSLIYSMIRTNPILLAKERLGSKPTEKLMINESYRIHSQAAHAPQGLSYQNVAQHVFDGGEKVDRIYLGSGQYTYTPAYTTAAYGLKLGKNSVYNLFDSWLKTYKPYAKPIKSEIVVGGPINANRTFSGDVIISKNDFEKFVKKVSGKSDKTTIAKYANTLQLTSYTDPISASLSTLYDKNGNVKASTVREKAADEYWVVPMIKSVPISGAIDFLINSEFWKKQDGSKVASGQTLEEED